jgi:hypothetical protein
LASSALDREIALPFSCHDSLERVGLELVNLGESILHVLRDYETPLASVSEVPKQHDTVAGKLMQVQTLASVLPGDLWMWVELFRWGFQGLYLGVKTFPYA